MLQSIAKRIIKCYIATHVWLQSYPMLDRIHFSASVSLLLIPFLTLEPGALRHEVHRIDRDRPAARGSGPAARGPGTHAEVAAGPGAARAAEWGARASRYQVAGRDADGAAEVRGHRDHHAPGTGRPTWDPERERRSLRTRDRRRGHVERCTRTADRSQSGYDAVGERERIPVQRLADAAGGAPDARRIPQAVATAHAGL